MGGAGSGRRRVHRAPSINECPRIHIDDLLLSGLLKTEMSPPNHRSMMFAGGLQCVIRMVQHLSPGKAALVLHPGLLDIPSGVSEDRSHSVVIVDRSSKRRRVGGWAFICTRMLESGPCGKAVMSLYLPPSSDELGCRHCHALRYSSPRMEDGRLRIYYNNPGLLTHDFMDALVQLRLGRPDPLKLRLVSAALARLKEANDTLSFLDAS